MKIESSLNAKREMWCDIFKALLIISVVVGHSWIPYTEIIFWFHMPLFFVISGYTLKYRFPAKNHIKDWIKRKTKRFMIPYFFWFFVSCALESNLTTKRLLGVIWGGEPFQKFIGL